MLLWAIAQVVLRKVEAAILFHIIYSVFVEAAIFGVMSWSGCEFYEVEGKKGSSDLCSRSMERRSTSPSDT